MSPFVSYCIKKEKHFNVFFLYDSLCNTQNYKHSLAHIYFAASLYYKLQAVDIKHQCNAAQLTSSSLSALALLFENLTSVRVNTWAQMFSAKAQIDSFQSSLFPHKPMRSFHKKWFIFHTVIIIMYSSSEKFCFCRSHTDKFTKLPCSLVDSCVVDGCDEGSLMFWL